MKKPSSVSWWSSFGFGKRAAAEDSDYADMGTAFGLDASLDTLPAEEANGVEGDPSRVPDRSTGKRAKR